MYVYKWLFDRYLLDFLLRAFQAWTGFVPDESTVCGAGTGIAKRLYSRKPGTRAVGSRCAGHIPDGVYGDGWQCLPE